MNSPWLTLEPLIVGVVLTGCSVDDGVLGGLNKGGAPNGSSSDAGAGNQPTTTCGPGPLVTLSDGTESYPACTGHLAAAQFLNALCSCSVAEMGSFIQTRGFDSTRGEYRPGQIDDSGASVGVNGSYVPSAGYTDIGGSLSIAGSASTTIAGSLQVRGDFRAAGDVTVAGTATIARNAWLGGSLVALGPVSVRGALRHQGEVIALPLSAGSESEEPVSIPQPCACAAAELVPVRRLVEAARNDNDNDRFDISVGALTGITQDTTLALGCGRYYLEEVKGQGNLRLEVTGQAALFVAGSLELEGDVEVRLASSAALDMFVAGDWRVSGAVQLSSKARPSAGRLYLGGSAEVTLTSPWIGNLYAPTARVSAAAPLQVWGSIMAGAFSSASSASFVYDRAVASAGSGCTAPRPPAGACNRCGWCSAGTACVGGECSACRTDEDCCSQSVCSNGSCTALVELR